jgi:hypothetical protein
MTTMESEAIRTTMHGLKHGSCPLRSRAITRPLTIGAEPTGDHELVIRTTLGLAFPPPVLDAGATHVLGRCEESKIIASTIKTYIACYNRKGTTLITRGRCHLHVDMGDGNAGRHFRCCRGYVTIT